MIKYLKCFIRDIPQITTGNNFENNIHFRFLNIELDYTDENTSENIQTDYA